MGFGAVEMKKPPDGAATLSGIAAGAAFIPHPHQIVPSTVSSSPF
jgi:hypothetical protein